MATKKTPAPAQSDPPKYAGRGGWRNGGRPKLAEEDFLHKVSIRFSTGQREKLAALGGADWIRWKLDKTRLDKAPAAPAPVRTRGAEPDDVLVVGSIRLNTAHHEKLAELGGSAWLRKRIDLARVPK